MFNEPHIPLQFEPFPKAKGLERGFKTDYGQSVVLSFEQAEKMNLEIRDEALELVSDLVQEGYNYVMAATQAELKLSQEFTIEFSEREMHAHQGILMSVATDRIMTLIHNPNDKKLRYLECSLFTHELMHNITDDEDFPMLIEMIYMLEHEQQWRLKDIQRLLEEGVFTPNYIKGLESIASWLGYSDSQEMLSDIVTRNIADMKQIFKQRILEYLQKESIS